MADEGHQLLFEVDADLQILVPTVDEVNYPTEQSQELKDLYAFEQSLLSTKFTCRDCGSEAHVSGLCEQNEGASTPPATSPGAQQVHGGGYRSVSSLLGEHVGRRHNGPPNAHQHHVSAMAETVHLLAQGLNVPSTVFDAQYRALADPRLRLQRLVDSLKPPVPALEHAAIGAILTTCGFGAHELAAVMSTFDSVFNGRVSASNLALLVSCSLNRTGQGGVR